MDVVAEIVFDDTSILSSDSLYHNKGLRLPPLRDPKQHMELPLPSIQTITEEEECDPLSGKKRFLTVAYDEQAGVRKEVDVDQESGGEQEEEVPRPDLLCRPFKKRG